MRVESDRPVVGSDGSVGWIHRLADPLPAVRPARTYTPKPEHRLIDCAAVMARYQASTSRERLFDLAASLGVTVRSLRAIGAAWAGPRQAWAFPMRDGAGAIVGIQLRKPDGQKLTVPGSHVGLFYAPDHMSGSPVLVVEGPTDTAALLDLGYSAVGRASCRAGGPQLAQLLAGRHVVIVSDRDEAHFRPNGDVYYPGQEGANHLAERLCPHVASMRVILPPRPFKDAREWVTNGATQESLNIRIRMAYEW